MRFIEEVYPILITVAPPEGVDATYIRDMAAFFERQWKLKRRYALISASASGNAGASAHGRKLIVDYANSPRVRAMSKEFCVGAATIVPNAFARGALTALLWLWTPPTPHYAAAAAEDAADYCIGQLEAARIALPGGAAALRARAIELAR